MKSNKSKTSCKRGFTLIELLVVVLMIGILAAVAVPQYQKAVEKSKATQVIPLLKTLYEAQQAYYLANGEFATNFSQLDVDFPYTGKQAWSPDSLNIDTRSNQDWSIQLYKNAGNGRAISAGRVSGPYKGAGFFIYTAGGGPLGEIICAERGSGGISFTPPFGRYCATLWGGKLTSGGDLKEYKLP